MMKNRIRTIITQDAEVDDQNSLRHILLYANELEIQGIVQTSSVFHWQGVPGAVTPQPEESGPSDFPMETAPYDRPYRWTGTAWMQRTIDDYAAVYPNLKRHCADYPEPEALRKLIAVGNVGYPGEMLASTAGSELIRRRILDDDPRPLYIQVWGGMNTIARALMDIEREGAFSEERRSCLSRKHCSVTERQPCTFSEEMRSRLSRKVILTACGEQDTTYRSYIAEQWPEIRVIKCLQMGSYSYAWGTMPEGESKNCLRADFMKKITDGNGPLTDGYAVWLDGKYYEGEGPRDQFGANEHVLDEWWGAFAGLPAYQKGDFISEGDSPTFLCLLDRTAEHGREAAEERDREAADGQAADFAKTGFAGRYVRDESQKNSKGQPLNYWVPAEDDYTDADGQTVRTESMWGQVAAVQQEFAQRAGWCRGEEG